MTTYRELLDRINRRDYSNNPNLLRNDLTDLVAALDREWRANTAGKPAATTAPGRLATVLACARQIVICYPDLPHVQPLIMAIRTYDGCCPRCGADERAEACELCGHGMTKKEV